MVATTIEITPGDVEDLPFCLIGFPTLEPDYTLIQSLQLQSIRVEGRQRLRIDFDGFVPGHFEMSLDTARELRAALARFLDERPQQTEGAV
jgi:hypothetical protein